jgi:hypothetical protein
LPYSSLNEVNYATFDELSLEYHNELFGYIIAEGDWATYKTGKSVRDYNKLNRDGCITPQSIVLTEYIRHQIHHPENDRNAQFTKEELKESIEAMRSFISGGFER